MAALTAITANVPEIEFLMVPRIMPVIVTITESRRRDQLRGVEPNAHGQNDVGVPIDGNCCKKTTANLTGLSSLGRTPALSNALRAGRARCLGGSSIHLVAPYFCFAFCFADIGHTTGFPIPSR